MCRGGNIAVLQRMLY